MRHLVKVSSHLLYEQGDDESTRWTVQAKAKAQEEIERLNLNARTSQWVETDRGWIILEAVGQDPDRFKFRQGLRLERLRFLMEVNEQYHVPVLLAFYHGLWERAWLSALPPHENIALTKDGRDSGRVGWYAGEDEELGVFWVSETLDLVSPPPERLPRANEWASFQGKLTAGL